MTYAEAKQHHLNKLYELGWAVHTGYDKDSCATHPDKDLRICFKSKTVHASRKEMESWDTTWELWLDLLKVTTREIIEHAESILEGQGKNMTYERSEASI